MTSRRLAAAICAVLLAPPGLAPADQKPVSPPSTPTPPKYVVQKPDLVVSFEGSGPGLPKGFTVKNVGNDDSKLSILKVTATWVPPRVPSFGEGNDPMVIVFSSEKMKATCGNPFPEVLEAVPVLKPGESKTFTRDTGPFQILVTGVFLISPPSHQATHVKPCPPTLVCAWDVKAVADASNDNDERNESNNTASRHSLREVSFK